VARLSVRILAEQFNGMFQDGEYNPKVLNGAFRTSWQVNY
jgi:hypothetical protein